MNRNMGSYPKQEWELRGLKKLGLAAVTAPDLKFALGLKEPPGNVFAVSRALQFSNVLV